MPHLLWILHLEEVSLQMYTQLRLGWDWQVFGNLLVLENILEVLGVHIRMSPGISVLWRETRPGYKEHIVLCATATPGTCWESRLSEYLPTTESLDAIKEWRFGFWCGILGSFGGFCPCVKLRMMVKDDLKYCYAPADTKPVLQHSLCFSFLVKETALVYCFP